MWQEDWNKESKWRHLFNIQPEEGLEERHVETEEKITWSENTSYCSASVKSTEEKEMMSLQLNYARKELKVYDDTV